jgi:tetrahydromethanopterin S-methyltransferase subunit G
MDEEELAPLIEFIGKKFDQVDQRLGGMDRRLDQMATKDEVRAQQAETRRHFDVVAEGLRSQIQLVAEGVSAVDQRLDRFQRKVEEEFAETRAAIRFSYAQLERRILDLEGNYAALNERVERLEVRPA